MTIKETKYTTKKTKKIPMCAVFSLVFFKLKKNEKKIDLGFFVTVTCTDEIVDPRSMRT